MRDVAVVVGGLAAVAVLGWIDRATGPEISFSIFYLAPIGAAAWLSGRMAGLLLATVAAVVWGVVELQEGAPSSLSSLVPLWNTGVRFGFFVITAWLVSDVRRMHAQERLLARRDALTGLANARALLESLEREIDRMRRTGSPLTVAYLDLDRFKAVNDILGHSAGDALLRQVATVLGRDLRSVDVLARLGGDEFALVLPDTDAEAATVALERSLEGVRAAVRKVAGGPEGVSVTIGAVVFRRPPPSAQATIRAADDWMYEAKRAGRDRLLLSDPDAPPLGKTGST